MFVCLCLYLCVCVQRRVKLTVRRRSGGATQNGTTRAYSRKYKTHTQTQSYALYIQIKPGVLIVRVVFTHAGCTLQYYASALSCEIRSTSTSSLRFFRRVVCTFNIPPVTGRVWTTIIVLKVVCVQSKQIIKSTLYVYYKTPFDATRLGKLCSILACLVYNNLIGR